MILIHRDLYARGLAAGGGGGDGDGALFDAGDLAGLADPGAFGVAALPGHPVGGIRGGQADLQLQGLADLYRLGRRGDGDLRRVNGGSFTADFAR